ncbi:radical SAM family heme chaperone HemW [Acetonema longum]|uniref:Heme chaperone HemW n=1 Tax=Acetonema longum DSM 6540 TaxID=1009370 RepID=F7NKV9_9FIRM|nr:radical SAM family heme chaperone HemW [Acetonema longum]EGO63302.1 putative oxygen-independent coproporphyrinogen III oxidase [Acetonema longum DSM 6540]
MNAEILNSMEAAQNNLGLYIHIPFCRQKCYYCDFVSYTDSEAIFPDYVAALCREIADQGGLFTHRRIDTVYIGGGTPTLLTDSLVTQIMETLSGHFHLTNNAEISMEANPGTVDRVKLKLLRSLGINRISFGVQAFQDRLLKMLGRIHTAQEGREAVVWAHQAGFDNINIDLMLGLPGQVMSDLKDSIAIACSLGVRHISAYSLTVEPTTILANQLSRGLLHLPAEEAETDMYEYVTEVLPQLGYNRYEISNYAQSDYECRHNLKYWHYQPYIGIGAAAYSFLGDKRMANNDHVAEYIERIRQGASPVAETEIIPNPIAIAEYTFLAMRTIQGLCFSDFSDRFGMDFQEYYRDVLPKLINKQLLILTDRSAFLSSAGLKYSNQIFADFLPEE